MHFCTILDANFILRVLALEKSLQAHGRDYLLHAVCTDTEAFTLLGKINNSRIHPIALQDIERRFPELKTVETKRQRYEYIMTCKPFVLRQLLETEPSIDILTYLDGDLFFFDDPQAILKELGEGSMLLTPHREPDNAPKKGRHGIFNAGFIAVRNNDEGKSAMKWWSEQTLEWCFDRVEDNRFIDQKYLNQLPDLFKKVIVSSHPGLNAAPWNVGRHRFSLKRGTVTVDRQPLVFYHFHAFKKIKPWLYESGLSHYRVNGSVVLTRYVYGAYLATLHELRTHLRETYGLQSDLATVRIAEKSATPSLPLILSRIWRKQWMIGIR